MSGSRMGYDLLTVNGWRNLYWPIRFKSYRSTWVVRCIWVDTFKQIWCWLFEHDRYDCSDAGDATEHACHRCEHYVK